MKKVDRYYGFICLFYILLEISAFHIVIYIGFFSNNYGFVFLFISIGFFSSNYGLVFQIVICLCTIWNMVTYFSDHQGWGLYFCVEIVFYLLNTLDIPSLLHDVSERKVRFTSTAYQMNCDNQKFPFCTTYQVNRCQNSYC